MTKRQATRLVVLFGIVSLFADMTYEGARAMTGPLLATFGASAAAVGITAGFGEFVAYGLRLASGWLADRTKHYWLLTFAGYAVNVLAVPLLAFAGSWEAVAVLTILERAGKALRGPSRDTILSQAAAPIGYGWAFGLHEFLDQLGAIGGPVFMALAVSRSSIQSGFLLLTIPAVLSLVTLAVTRMAAPPIAAAKTDFRSAKFQPRFRTALIAAGLMGAGIADFAMIAFHANARHLLSVPSIALMYAGAQAADALSAVLLGRLFDRYGPGVLEAGCLLGAAASMLAFSESPTRVVLGALFWGAALGCHGSVLKATVTSLTGRERRAWAFGIFHSVYGLFCFAGSAAVGLLYQQSIPAAMIFSAALQIAALPVIVRLIRQPPPHPAVE